MYDFSPRLSILSLSKAGTDLRLVLVYPLRDLRKGYVNIGNWSLFFLTGRRLAVKLCRRAESFTSLSWSQELLRITQGLEQTFQQYITQYYKLICLKFLLKKLYLNLNTLFWFYYYLISFKVEHHVAISSQNQQIYLRIKVKQK